MITVYAVLLFCGVHYLEILKSRQSQITQPVTGSCNRQQPEPIDLKTMLSKLPVSLAANVNNFTVHIAVDRRAKYVYIMHICICH